MLLMCPNCHSTNVFVAAIADGDIEDEYECDDCQTAFTEDEV